MSDIPKAYAILELAVRSDDVRFIHKQIRAAMAVMKREKPGFIARTEHAPVTREQAEQILQLRARGYSLQTISEVVGTQLGRVSEVVNGHRKGV